MNLPDGIAQYLVALATQQRDLAYLHVSPEGHILSSGGMLTKYSLDAARVGDAIDQHLLFLAGFFPRQPEDEVMQYIQTEQGHVVNVHFITCGREQITDPEACDADNFEAHPSARLAAAAATATEQWILLLDATAEIKKEQQFQQIANDLTLVRQRLTKQISQAHHQSIEWVDQSINTLIDQPNNAEDTNSTVAKQISILIIKVDQSSLTLTQLNEFFAEMTQLISDENGLIHHVFGPTAVALFGLVPTSFSPAVQAARVAKRLIHRSARHHIALGITGGDATIGTINHAHQQTINIDGPAIATAFAIRNLLREGSYHPRLPHSLIVDALTLQDCQTELSAFSTHPLHCDQPPALYRLIPK